VVAAFGLATIARLRRRENHLSLLLAESAIVSRSPLGTVEVPWDAVTRVSERTVSGARYLEVDHDGHVRRGLVLRWARRVRLGPRDRLWLPLERVDADPDALVAAIARLHDEPDERRRIATGELAADLGVERNLTPASPR